MKNNIVKNRQLDICMQYKYTACYINREFKNQPTSTFRVSSTQDTLKSTQRQFDIAESGYISAWSQYLSVDNSYSFSRAVRQRNGY